MVVAQGVTSGGVRYVVRDDCAAARDSEEGKRRAAEQNRVARAILEACAQREAQESA